MEFFEEIENQDIDIASLQSNLRISTLPDFCNSINSVISEHGNGGEIYCLWGLFTISREVIRNGVRFALLNCPHALAWTVTFRKERSMLVVHCTIDDRQESEEFVESIQQFLADWRRGLSDRLAEIT